VDTSLLVIIASVFFFAGLVKGVVGIGLPTIAMGLLCLFMPALDAAALLVVPGVVTNIWQVLAGPALGRLLRRFAIMVVALIGGTLATIGMFAHGSGPLSVAILGAALVTYGLSGLLLPPLRISVEAERWLSPIAGLLTGLLNGFTGVFVIPGAPYLASLKMSREELIQSLGIVAFTCPAALGIGLWMHHAYKPASATFSFLAALPALAGMYSGQLARARLPAGAFLRLFLVGLISLGAYMMWRTMNAWY
jgi:uncharacterized protein